VDGEGAERLALTTSDGERLDAELSRADEPRAAVVLAHPHPEFGGSMHVPFIEALFRALPVAGITTLRFDFRGVGQSTGAHTGGDGERLDVEAAVASPATQADGAPVVTVGWSFGGDVSLGVVVETIAGWVAVAPPLQVPGHAAAGHDPRPLLLLVPEHDQLNPPDSARPKVADWESTRLEVIPSTDHFLLGRSGWVAEQVAAFVDELVGR